MVLASITELQSSETFKLVKFWDDKQASKDKKNMQSQILKIVFEGIEGLSSGTMVEKPGQSLDGPNIQ